MNEIDLNNVIPSYNMKFMQWLDVEGSDDVEAQEEDQYLEDVEDEDEVEDVQGLAKQSQVLQV
jgi:hypothetical protein